MGGTFGSFQVFGVTAFASIFAYVWMVIVLTDEYVYLYEAIITFLFFPLLVLMAFLADIKGRKMTVTDENAKLLSIVDGGLTANKEEVAAMIKGMKNKENKSPDEIAKEIMGGSETKSISRNQYRCAPPASAPHAPNTGCSLFPTCPLIAARFLPQDQRQQEVLRPAAGAGEGRHACGPHSTGGGAVRGQD